MCGKEFVTTTANKLLCSKECQEESNRIANRIHYHKVKAERKKKKEKINNKSVVDIAHEARKAGMSYGQYVSMREIGR